MRRTPLTTTTRRQYPLNKRPLDGSLVTRSYRLKGVCGLLDDVGDQTDYIVAVRIQLHPLLVHRQCARCGLLLQRL